MYVLDVGFEAKHVPVFSESAATKARSRSVFGMSQRANQHQAFTLFASLSSSTKSSTSSSSVEVFLFIPVAAAAGASVSTVTVVVVVTLLILFAASGSVSSSMIGPRASAAWASACSWAASRRSRAAPSMGRSAGSTSPGGAKPTSSSSSSSSSARPGAEDPLRVSWTRRAVRLCVRSCC